MKPVRSALKTRKRRASHPASDAHAHEPFGEKVKSDENFRKELKIRFVGQTDQSIFKSLEENGLTAFTEDIGYVDHIKSLELLAKARLLLLPLNDAPNVSGIIPGKLFEYVATGRPILVVGPEEGDSAMIIKETGAGKVAGFNDKEGMKKIIDDSFQAFLLECSVSNC